MLEEDIHTRAMLNGASLGNFCILTSLLYKKGSFIITMSLHVPTIKRVKQYVQESFIFLLRQLVYSQWVPYPNIQLCPYIIYTYPKILNMHILTSYQCTGTYWVLCCSVKQNAYGGKYTS